MKHGCIRKRKKRKAAADIFKSILVLGISTFISYFFSKRGFREANIITVYILGVLITAVVTSQRIYSLISSVISVLLFNFLFTEPRYTFNAYDAGYIATFLVMFIAAFITSSLAVRIKKQAIQSRKLLIGPEFFLKPISSWDRNRIARNYFRYLWTAGEAFEKRYYFL